AAGHSYSFTFNQAGTFTYHCMIHPFMTGTITVQSAGTAPSPTATGITSVIPATATPITLRAYPVKARVGAGQMMGASRPVSQPSWQGFYDGHKDTYLSTDVSSKAMATSMHVNFSPGLAHMSMAFTDPMYLVEGRAAANQIAVFGSQPGEADYSPLWHEIVVRWKAGAHAVLLTSDNQINSLQKKGKLTLQQNHVILNCPIVKI
ncbi:MAG TPA: plastocyanin/azurin family copper-binding protein, partial [Chloroflexota bacterium]